MEPNVYVHADWLLLTAELLGSGHATEHRQWSAVQFVLHYHVWDLEVGAAG